MFLLMMCTVAKFISLFILSVFIITMCIYCLLCVRHSSKHLYSHFIIKSPRRPGAIFILIFVDEEIKNREVKYDWPLVTQPVGDRGWCGVKHEKLSSFSVSWSMSSSMWKIAIGAPLSPHRHPFCSPHPEIRALVGQKTIFLITPSHQVWFPKEWFSIISSPCGTQMFSEPPYATSGKKHVGVLMGITVGPIGSVWNKINGTEIDDGFRAVSSD